MVSAHCDARRRHVVHGAEGLRLRTGRGVRVSTAAGEAAAQSSVEGAAAGLRGLRLGLLSVLLLLNLLLLLLLKVVLCNVGSVAVRRVLSSQLVAIRPASWSPW